MRPNRTAAGRALALGSVLAIAAFGAACGSTASSFKDDDNSRAGGVAASTPRTDAPGVAVSCGGGRRALVRQAWTSGQPVSLVDCVPSDEGFATVAAPPPSTSSPYVTWGPDGTRFVPATMPVQQVAYMPQASPTYVVQRPIARYPDAGARSARRVVRRSGRSWQKSAVIVGASAGIGAGVGAAVGGKKGALIGAALGGGGAAIWDQLTRHP